jgi:hypothetical protein
MLLRRALLTLAVLAALSAPLWAPVCVTARAAELDGVELPSTLQADGKKLQLNGYGLRLYSIFRIHIYVAALYLEHLSTNAEAILQSPETKLVSVQFVHSVSAEAARDSWRKGFENNCEAPCHLDPEDIERFLAEVPAMPEGANFSILFTQQGATVNVNGHPYGIIPKPDFARAVLATFLGPAPASPPLKAALLQGHG